MDEFEKERLQRTLGLLQEERNDLEGQLKELESSIQAAKENLWENARDFDHAEKAMVRLVIDQSTVDSEFRIRKLRRLDRLCNTPYFGRVDFVPRDKPQGDPVYVGVHAFHDPVSGEPLVHDWRAPVSSLFYDHELGPASYRSPSGEVTGELHRKRQYRIRKGRMESMVESGVSIHDDILRKELGGNADRKMRDIVATIQRDQNAIIRDESSDILVIQGVAGSGKSSIALHRVAYLLYRHKETLRSTDILIISPNPVFSDYISNVLPELGEENIPEIGIDKLAHEILGGQIPHETFFEQIARLVEDRDAAYAERVRFKSSPEFLDKLEQFLSVLAGRRFQACDVEIGPYRFPAEFFVRRQRACAKLSVARSVSRIVGDLQAADTRIRLTAAQVGELRAKVRAMFRETAATRGYKEFYAWLGCPQMLKQAPGRKWEYADLFPLAYLTAKLEGFERPEQVRHLLVDEMQDYTPIQYRVLDLLFRCRKTILGDASQRIHPFGSSTHESILKVFPQAQVVKLCKSYRSTWEITRFAQGISADPDLMAVERHGEPPTLWQVQSEAALLYRVERLVTEFDASEHATLSVVCREQAQADRIHRHLAARRADVFLLDQEARKFQTGVVVTTAYLAKGLEFDRVIVPWAGASHYSSESDRGLLYVACTRAMHRLDLVVIGDHSPLIPGAKDGVWMDEARSQRMPT